MIRKFMPVALGAVYALVPLYPSFIALTPAAYPGVSLVHGPLLYALMSCACIIVTYFIVTDLLYRKPGGQPLILPMFAWFAASELSAVLGFDPIAGLLFVGIFGGSVAWSCALVRFFDDRYVATTVFWSYLLSGTIGSAAALIMLATRQPASLYAIGHGRAIGTFILPGELAAYLIIFIPIAYAVARIGRGRALQMTGWVATAVGIVTLYATHSRAGWMGFAAALACLVATQVRSRHAAAAAAVVVAAGLAAVLLAFNVRHNPSEDYTRIAIWQAAVQVVDRFPLTGVGPFAFSRLYAVVHVPDADATAFHAHSLYLTFFAELGILGLGAFLATCWKFVAELRKRIPRATPRGALLACAAAAGLTGIAVQGLIDTMSLAIFGLMLPTMGFALAASAWQDER